MVRHLPTRQRETTPLRSCTMQWGVTGALLLLLTAGLIGCDNNATFTKIPFNFKEMQIVSAVPAVSDDP